MNVSLPSWPASYLSSLRDLEQLIELSGGFVLVPVEVEGPDLGRALGQWLTDHDHPALVIEPTGEQAWRELAPTLLEIRPDRRRGVVIVVGGALTPEGIYPGLRLLNQRRDSIVKHLGCPLLWCGPRRFLELTWERAPDFWSIRSIDRRLEPESAPEVAAQGATGAPLRELFEEARRQGDVRNAARIAVRLATMLIRQRTPEPEEARVVIDVALSGLGTGDAEERDLRDELLLERAEVERIRGESVAAATTLFELLGPETTPRHQVRAHLGLATLLENTMSSGRAEQSLGKALAIARAAGDRAGEAKALIGLGRLAGRAGRGRKEVIKPIEQAEAIATELGDDVILAQAIAARVEASVNVHDMPAARTLLDQAHHRELDNKIREQFPVDEMEKHPEFAELRSAYLSGNLILVAGPGITEAAGLPSWKRLVEILIDRAKARGASQAALAEMLELVDKEQLIEALSALKDCLGGPEFGTTIELHLNDKDKPIAEVLQAIAALAPRLRAVLTTNLDHLLERALGGAWSVLTHGTADIAQRRQYILKLHGTLLDRSTWVFTRDDYDRAIYTNPQLQSTFSALFHSSPLLFVGYGLADYDFDAILGRVRAFAGDQPPRHFALAPAETVTPFRRAKLEKAGIRIVAYQNTDGHHAEAARILRALAESGPRAAAPPPRELIAPAPPGTAYDPLWYIHRPREENLALGLLDTPGAALILRGPHGIGKTTMLRYLLEQARAQDAGRGARGLVVEVNPWLLLPEQPSLDGFLENLAHHLIKASGGDETLLEKIAQGPMPWTSKLSKLMEDHILSAVDGRVILVIDEADALAGQPFLENFFGMLRRWLDSADRGSWSQLRLVIVVSDTSLLEFRRTAASPFANRGTSIEIGDLDQAQARNLAQLYGIEWTSDVAAKLRPLVGGHPYLLRSLMYAAHTRGLAMADLARDPAEIERILSDHLEWLARQIEQDASLEESARQLLQDPGALLDPQAYRRLRDLGVVARDPQGLHFRYGLYEDYLRRRWSGRPAAPTSP